jgi:hypothetical protein
MKRSPWIVAALAALTVGILMAPAAASAKTKSVDVCKHGCDYRTIQDAVDHTGKNAVINVEPGTYKEGVLIEGSKHDGITIQGTDKNAKKTVLDGKNAKGADGQPAQDGLSFQGVDGARVLNLTVKNYLANGIHFVGPDVGKDKGPCNGYLAKNDIAAFNRSYGIFAFNCIGGRMTKSVGYGQGDSAYYVGATPFQDNPKITKLDHLEAYENVLGYSGTNSKYIDITDGDFYNNGVGIVPNTLDSEPYEPNATGVIENNNIFWNNFNYFLPNSKVKTVSSGLGTVGTLTIQYPTGAGVVLLGSDGWTVQNNNIFGNFKWGVATISDPTNDGDNAINMNNKIINNTMGAGGTDTNAVDFFTDGSGSNNCWSGNTSSTFDHSNTSLDLQLYPPCPAPPGTGGNGSSLGDSDQFSKLLNYVTTDPPENQECSWIKHDHPKFEKFKPLVITPGPTCN